MRFAKLSFVCAKKGAFNIDTPNSTFALVKIPKENLREKTVFGVNLVFPNLHNNSKEILDPQFWPYNKF